MRLIDADAFRREIDNHWPFTKEEQSKHGIADMAKSTLLCVLNQMPTVQPERKKGTWIQKSKPMEFSTVWWYECSECGDKPPRDRYGNPDYLSNYCPNCGADMRGEKDGN